ncbi:MAG: hypothetical protein IJY82_02130 [Oscillospiraceae bacterium]|nr:hypothetical protein [Oscillospiraceae bacterium]
MDKFEQILQSFAQPGVEYRSIPFWSWNGKLEPEELCRQSDALQAGGMGGYFMHSREGLETPYLGEEWLECIEKTVEHASRTGMEAWLYDEDKWPSGTAGGRVTADDRFRARAVTLEMTDRASGGEILRVFSCRMEEGTISELRLLSPAKEYAAAQGEILLVFRVELGTKCDWFNGQSAPDNLNPATVRSFLDHVYETYYARVGGEFGKTVPGIFTDEANIADSNNVFSGRGWIPWTGDFETLFSGMFGYSIADRLPWMFFEGEESFRTRHDFWYAVSRRFTEAYSAQISRWCAEKGLAFTGHFLFESDWGWGSRSSGAVMPHYRHQDVPGIDMLCNHIHETLTVKQCSSVANQMGKETVLSEMYAATGWEFTYEDQKQIGDWQYVLGVNRRSQHLALYSLRGCRKRDYPPSFHYNNCVFRRHKPSEDYFARIGAVMRPGKAVRDILVIHPQSTVWGRLGADPVDHSLFGDEYAAAANRMADRFNGFCEGLLAHHYDFDLGDEQLMAELGGVREGSLSVGQCDYPVVILAACETLLSGTVALLEEFVEKGGLLFAVDGFPTRVDGAISPRLETLKNHRNVIQVEEDGLNRALELHLPRRVDLRERNGIPAGNIWYLLKEHPDGYALFLVNNDKTAGKEVYLDLSFRGKILGLDPLTGNTEEITATSHGEGMRLALSILPNDSRLFLIRTDAPFAEAPQIIPARTVNFFAAKELFAVCGGPAEFRRSDPNVLVLDRCRYRLEQEEFSRPMELWRAQMEIRDRLKMRQVFYNGIYQRYHWIDTPHPADGTPLELEYTFRVEELPKTPVFLAMEIPQYFTVTLNGVRQKGEDCGWYIDREIRKQELTGLVEGENVLLLSCGYAERMEMEDSFLLGDFGVSGEGMIGREPETLRMGDWCLQGYPYYSGSMTYRFPVEYFPEEGCRAILRIGAVEAACVTVAVGAAERQIPWTAADGVDLTDLLEPGENILSVEVMGSQRNNLGPIHLSEQVMDMTNWCSYRSEGYLYREAPVLKAYGLTHAPILEKLRK